MRALFIGKFQPPHLGHVLTIKGLLRRFESVVIGVTEGKPHIIDFERVAAIFSQSLAGERVIVRRIPGAVDEGTESIDFEFDIVCSGNELVLKRLAAKGYKVEYVARSNDDYYSGTAIRRGLIPHILTKPVQEIGSFQIVMTSWLRPIEQIFKSHFDVLELAIIKEKVIRQPLIVDKLTGAVLDGSHRYAFLIKHGYEQAPAFVVDYSDESIFVGNKLVHRFIHDSDKYLNKSRVRDVALSGNLFAPRTTRHFFPFRKTPFPVKLSKLTVGLPMPIDHLLSSLPVPEQVAANRDYLNEIEEELVELRRYLCEEEKLKEYIRAQIAGMV